MENNEKRRTPLRVRLAAVGAALAVLAAAIFGWGVPAYAGAVTSLTSGNYYYIRYPTNNFCVDVQGASSLPGTPIQIWNCGPQWNQQFQFVSLQVFWSPNLFHVWQLHLRYAPNMCLAVDDGHTQSGTPYVTEPCSGGWEQYFELLNGGSHVLEWIFLPLYNNWDASVCLAVDTRYLGNGESVLGESAMLGGGPPYFQVGWQIWNSVP